MSEAWAYRHGLTTNWEMQECLEEIDRVFDPRFPPRVVLEIGTFQGDSLRIWREALGPSLLIGVQDTPETTPEVVEELRVKLIQGSSHDQATYLAVKKLLGGQTVDLLFIDGDHTYEGVRDDWDTYTPLVSPGGICILHDAVIEDNPTVDVYRLYQELRTYHRSKLIFGGGNCTGSAVFYL